MTNFFTQAYKQAPWRREKRISGAILLLVILVAAVSMLYLFVNNERAAAGVSIQLLEIDRRQALRNIADLRTQLATLTSATQLRARAVELGYQPMNPEEALYIVIPGYPGRQANIPMEIQAKPESAQVVLLPSYTESLWDWLLEKYTARPGASQ